MTTKGWLVVGFLIAALISFLFVGFGHGGVWPGHDLIGIGLAAFIVAVLVHIFMGGSELKA